MVTYSFLALSTLYGTKLLMVISVVVGLFTTYLLLFFLVLKNWIIFYKYHWQYYTMQSKWQQLINKNVVNLKNQQNWFIENNKTYGNLHWIYKRLAVIFSIAFMINSSAAVYCFLDDFSLISCIIGGGMESMTFSPLSLVYAIIVCKTPTFDDTFSIHWESKMHSKLLIILMIINPIMIVLYIIFGGMASTSKLAEKCIQKHCICTYKCI